MNVVEPFVRQALAFPERAALVTADNVVRYGQLHTSARKAAAGLRLAGVRPGDRVVLDVGGQTASVALTLALAMVGAVAVSMPQAAAAEELAVLHADLEVRFVLRKGDQGAMPSHDGFAGVLELDSIVAAADDGRPFHAAGPDDIWRIAPSSGTTGRPKGITMSHGTTLLNVQLQRTIFPTGTGDRGMVLMNAGSSFGVNYWLRYLYAGAAMIVAGASDAETLRLIHERKVTQIVTHPRGAIRLAGAVRQAQGALAAPAPSLRFISCGGGVVPPQLQQTLRTGLCPNLLITYGSTETYLLAVLDPHTREKHPQATGRLIPWVEAVAVDEAGHGLPPGERGRLRFRSPTLATGYVGQGAQAESANFADGWFLSSDVGTVSVDGVVQLAGRVNDVISMAGVKIDPARLEALILEDAAIMDCAVVDLPRADGRPLLAAALVAAGQVDTDAMRKRCGPVHEPDAVFRVPQLPRNEMGKVQRAELRQQLLGVIAQAQAQRKERA
jgi:acyl-coenzyme A synthetase/AMP-(fatty) acid ligase